MHRVNIYILMTIQLIIAGGTHIVAKAVVTDVDAAPLLFLRTLISSTGLLLFFALKSGRLRVERRDWGSIALLGFLGIVVNQFCYLYGIKFTTAANGALLYAATPVFVLLLSRFFLKERITQRKIMGIVLAFTGIAIVIFERGIDFSSGYAFGNVLVLLAVIAWSFFTILGKPMIIKYGSLPVTTAMMLAGSMMFFPFGLFSALSFPFSTLTTLHWAGILYLGVGTSILGYVLWYHALGRIETSKAAVFANGQPLFATLLSVVFLNYTITGNFVLGGLITIAGVILTQLG